MMKRKFLTAVALVVSALGLAGCFEMRQDFTFRADGTAEAAITLVVDAALIAMSEEGNEDAEPWCDSEMIQMEGVTTTTTRSTEGSDVVCEIRVAGSTETLVAAIAEAEIAPGEQPAEGQSVSITSEGDRHEFRLWFPPMPQEEDEDNPMAESAKAMMLARMSGRVMSFSVTAPQIIETNGEISEDGTTATITRPMAEAMTSDEGTEFLVTFRTSEPSLVDRVFQAFQ